ncbi:MAG: hypothetical protein LRY69_07590 [Gammaproteobacteria bacterium]|nr:hypothetical protein [Gammaproteobacteria bacterium]
MLILSILHIFSVPGFTINNTSLPRALFAALTFHLNWLESQINYLPGAWDVLWTLSVEETFYIFFPLFCWTYRKPRLFIAMMFTFIFIGPYSRTHAGGLAEWDGHAYLSCMDGIAMGCLAALVTHQMKLTKKLLLACWDKKLLEDFQNQ